MVATLKVDKIQRVNADSDMISLHDTGITINTPLTDNTGEILVNHSITGKSLQVVASQFHSGSSHETTTSSQSPDTHGVRASCDITVLSATSNIDVSLYTSMSYGAAGTMLWYLKYSLNNGSTWTNIAGNNTYGASGTITPGSQQLGNNGATSLNGSQQSLSYYGWSYDASTWGPRMLRFFHDHNQPAGTTIRYGVFTTNTSAVTNYFLHANYMLGNWRLEEIGDMGRT